MAQSHTSGTDPAQGSPKLAEYVASDRAEKYALGKTLDVPQEDYATTARTDAAAAACLPCLLSTATIGARHGAWPDQNDACVYKTS